MGERAPCERYAADGVAVLERADLGDDAPPAQLSHQQVEAAELEIAAEDSPDPLSLSVIDRDLSTLGVIAKRGHASDPEPLALGSRDLVADALGSPGWQAYGVGNRADRCVLHSEVAVRFLDPPSPRRREAAARHGSAIPVLFRLAPHRWRSRVLDVQPVRRPPLVLPQATYRSVQTHEGTTLVKITEHTCVPSR